MMAVMPGIVWILARDFSSVPGKFELAVFLSRVTFPYLALISLVAMLSGLLNARSRFAPGAFAPVLLNIVLIGGIITGWWLRGDSHDDRIVAIALAVAVSLAGVAQLAYLWWAVRRAGLRLHLRLPRLTPEVRRLGMLILPATFGAGIYQISQFVDTFFATSLPQGSLTLLKLADRLNQLPLGIVGIALGTAILPMLSRHIHSGDAAEAQRLQSNAFEMATLLTLPAAAALAICAPAFVTAFFVGGKFTAADGAIMAHIVVALVAGLPAYVIVKILNPGFFAREDTRTPVWTALAALTRLSAERGPVVLAANGIFHQLFVLMALLLDGFENAAQVLNGERRGADDRAGFTAYMRAILWRGFALAAGVSIALALFAGPLIDTFAATPAVAKTGRSYAIWLAIMPFAGVAAFVFDGVFVGASWTRALLVSMIGAAAVYAASLWLTWPLGNDGLWLSFVLFLALRAVFQLMLVPRLLRQEFGSD